MYLPDFTKSVCGNASGTVRFSKALVVTCVFRTKVAFLGIDWDTGCAIGCPLLHEQNVASMPSLVMLYFIEFTRSRNENR